MVNYLELPIGERAPEVVEAVIEIPFEGINKYEYDKKLHVFRLDRNLYSPVHYPGDYGFIPSTLSDDGDPLDVLVMVDAPSFTGCVMEVRDLSPHPERDHSLFCNLQRFGRQASRSEGLAQCGLCAGPRDARCQAVQGRKDFESADD